MDDDKIKDLFDNFQPTLSSDATFLSNLRQNMKAVEMVKKQVAAQRRRNKIAVVVAAVLGFASGAIMTLLAPAICNWLSAIQISLPNPGVGSIGYDGQILAWMITATISSLVAYNAYQLTVARLSAKA